MTEPTLASVTVTCRYEVAPERVFDAFLDVSIARRFLFATATGEMIVARIDARVGGRYSFIERRPDMGEVEHVGEYLEIDRPRRLVFTFGVPKFSALMTRVSIDLKPLPTGCELTLTHEGVLPEWLDRTREGWGKIVAGLGAHLTSTQS